jgi:catechol 2,3-dioxygenase-like lactoylglutathione lyase family enzyme
MFSHVMVASNDIERSKKFYDAIFQAAGGKPGEQDAKGACGMRTTVGFSW